MKWNFMAIAAATATATAATPSAMPRID